jgi:integrase
VKHKDVQVLSLTGELAEVIERRQQARHPDSPWVFHRDGRPVQDFPGAWRKALQEAGVEDYVFYNFRRTATRNMVLAGVPEKHIMQVTEHKTRHMIDRYNITVEGDTQNTMAYTQAYLIQQRHRRLGRQSDTPPPEEP